MKFEKHIYYIINHNHINITIKLNLYKYIQHISTYTQISHIYIIQTHILNYTMQRRTQHTHTYVYILLCNLKKGILDLLNIYIMCGRKDTRTYNNIK